MSLKPRPTVAERYPEIARAHCTVAEHERLLALLAEAREVLADFISTVDNGPFYRLIGETRANARELLRRLEGEG